MTIITAKLVADSIAHDTGVRLRSFECVYPAFFHQDVMTHRRFARSALSTRAIPVKEMRRRIREEMAEPTYWGKNQPGMQADTELQGIPKMIAEWAWRRAGMSALFWSGIMNYVGSAKQNANMPLWPYMHFKTLITSTDFGNFYALRDHSAARPELQLLAKRMREAQEDSIPVVLHKGDWHLPYIRVEERNIWSPEQCRLVSTSRSARLSYDKHDGKVATLAEETALFKRLVGSQPLHASPAEHQGTPDTKTTMVHRFGRDGNLIGDPYLDWDNPELHGNFIGFIQHRKLLPGEAVNDVEPTIPTRYSKELIL